MTRVVDRPVRVHVAPDGTPLWFSYRGRHRVARVIERWQEIGEWWEGRGERTVYRVATDAGGLFELDFRTGEERWYLYKTYD